MGFTNIDELTMTDTEFQKFKKIIYEQVGINLLPHKKIMLQGRIKKRLKKLEIESFSEYYDIIQKDSKELIEMFNVVSTNKTEFFRENHHFEFLKEVIPEIINQNNKTGEQKLSIWCAASSTGEEPYSIAMTLAKFPILKNWKTRIIASDISTNVLTKAAAGIYSEESVEKIPKDMLKSYFRKLDDSSYVVNNDLKELIKFKRINLISENYPFKGEFEVIFCRNVMIYFDKKTQMAIVENFLRYLKKGGYLILGSSESLPTEMLKANEIRRIKSTIFQKMY